jgi:hypothetical protein
VSDRSTGAAPTNVRVRIAKIAHAPLARETIETFERKAGARG